MHSNNWIACRWQLYSDQNKSCDKDYDFILREVGKPRLTEISDFIEIKRPVNNGHIKHINWILFREETHWLSPWPCFIDSLMGLFDFELGMSYISLVVFHVEHTLHLRWYLGMWKWWSRSEWMKPTLPPLPPRGPGPVCYRIVGWNLTSIKREINFHLQPLRRHGRTN